VGGSGRADRGTVPAAGIPFRWSDLPAPLHTRLNDRS